MKRTLLAALFAVCAVGSVQAGALYAINDSTNSLVTIDRTTYAVTTIGALGTGGDFGDMTWNSSTGVMFAVGGRGNNALYTINTMTGAAALVGSHGISDMFSLAYNLANGLLYAQATNGNLYTLDSTTGAAALIGNNGVYPGGLAYSSVLGDLLLNEAGGGRIYSLNTGTGAASLLASPGSINDNGFTEDRELGGYWAVDWNQRLYRYDNAFNRTNVAGLGAAYAALAWAGDVNRVPEPHALVLVGLGLWGVALSRRRLN